MGSAGRCAERRPDSQQLVRQWTLLRLLCDTKEPRDIKWLAEQLNVSKATIERDLATLEHDFAIVEETVGQQKKTYRIDNKIRALDSIKFGTAELLAVYAGYASLSGFVGTPIHDDLHSVVTKIRGFLSPRYNGGLEAMSRVFLSHARGHVDYTPHQEVIDQLVDAVARLRICKLTYHAAWKGSTREHVARPLRLVWHQSALYLFACLGDRKEISTLAVHRIRQLEVTDEVFKSPKLDVAEHIAKAFGIFVSDEQQDVEILFQAEIAWRVEERVFHPHEQKERQADGSLVYRVRSGAQWEIIPWVQSFGALAELVAPASWREIIRRTLMTTLQRYAS